MAVGALPEIVICGWVVAGPTVAIAIVVEADFLPAFGVVAACTSPGKMTSCCLMAALARTRTFMAELSIGPFTHAVAE